MPCECTVQLKTVAGYRYSGVNDDGSLSFEQKLNPYQYKQYRSFFGPYVAHKGTIYCDSDNNINKAFTRLGSIAASTRDEEDVLIFNQEQFFTQNKLFLRRLDLIKLEFERIVLDMNCYDEFYNYIHAPHKLRKQRIQAFERLISDGRLLHKTFVDVVIGKLKLIEWAKPAKYPRLINDFTIVGSLLGGFVAKLVKQAMSNKISEDNFSTHFIASPQKEALHDAFHSLHFLQNELTFVYYSDDASFSDKNGKWNMDIKSCDRSNHKPVFDALQFITGNSEFSHYMKRTIKQCTLPIKVKRDGVKVRLKPTEPTLYSGSVLTTIINNLANLAIACSIFSNNDISVKDASMKAGYLVTLEECKIPEDVQFLKHSYSLINGSITPWLNLGVVMRFIGNCKYDLGQRGSIEKRAKDFNYSLIEAIQHGGSNEVVKAYRQIFSGGKLVNIDAHKPYFDFSGCDIDTNYIIRRYKCTENHVQEFISLIKQSGFGDQISCYFTRVVMSKDYGL